jgi:hypothetical protein
MADMKKITVKENVLMAAAADGMDAFMDVFVNAINGAIGGELNADNMGQLNADQTTLLAYKTVRDEVMDGGFVQLIHNGYGGFIFVNPFAKMMRAWGLRDLSKLIFDASHLYKKYGKEIEQDCTDEEFMALFEKFPEFDDMDDEFVENEEQWTEGVARYIDENLEKFAEIEKEDE